MSVSVTVNGVTYTIPQKNEKGWGDNVTSWIQAISSGLLQESGGAFTLTGEVDFGSSFGLKALYVKSEGTNIAATGVIRLANGESISWRNTGNSSDQALQPGSADGILKYNGVDIPTISSTHTLTNKTISGASNTLSNIPNSSTSATSANTASTIVARDALGNFSAGTITASLTGNATNVTGTVALANGGTGQTTQQAALDAISGTQSSGKYLRSDGTHTTLSTIQAADVPTLNQNTTGTATNVTGIVAIANGGTGQSSASAAFGALSPLTTKGDLLVYGSSNTRLGIGSDGQVPVADSTQANGLSWKTLQQGAKNYITYSSFENNSTNGWSLNHTTLSSNVPNQVSGSWSAASGSLAISVVSSGALGGSYSLQQAWTGTTSVPGDMLVSQAYTIDKEDQAKVLAFKFYFSATAGASLLNFSGTSSNTYQIYIYDVTNSAWIQPAGVYNMVQSSGVGIAQGTFQTPSNMTQFRIAIVCINASTSGSHTLLFDDFYVGPQSLAFGPPIGNWQSYTPTFGGLGTVTVDKAEWRQVGGNIEIRGRAQTGTVAASTATLSLPSGISVDTTLFGSATVVGAVSRGTVSDSLKLNMVSTDTNNLHISASLTDSNGSSAFTSSENFGWYASVPVSGWSSNTVMSADSDTRICALQASGQPAPTTAYNPVIFPSATYDTHGAYNTTTGRYTAPSSGYYRVSGFLNASFAATGYAQIYVNGTMIVDAGLFYATGGAGNFANTVKANAGDLIDIRPTINSGTYSGTGSSLSIEKVSGPAVVAASETITCSVRRAGSSQTGITSSAVVVGFDTVDDDSHGAFSTSTNLYTCPSRGRFKVESLITFNNTNQGTNSYNDLFIYKNGSEACRMRIPYSGNTSNYSAVIARTIKCNAGDTLAIYCSSSTAGATIDSGSDTYWNCLSIERVGN